MRMRMPLFVHPALGAQASAIRTSVGSVLCLLCKQWHGGTLRVRSDAGTARPATPRRRHQAVLRSSIAACSHIRTTPRHVSEEKRPAQRSTPLTSHRSRELGVSA